MTTRGTADLAPVKGARREKVTTRDRSRPRADGGPPSQRRTAADARPGLPDESLVVLAVDGDEAAFARLVRRYQRRLRGFLGQLVGDSELARELAQETFIRAWTALDRFDPRFRFSTWLFRIAHNLGIDHLRRRRLQTVPMYRRDADGEEAEVLVADTGKDPLGHCENSELAQSLRRTIDGLRPEQRELVLLRHFGGLSYQEIAELKGMPLGTVKNKLFRAHTVLREALKEFL